jgi:biotin carboxyl carrier protein
VALGVAKEKSSADIQAAATTIAPKVIETLAMPDEASIEAGREAVKAPMAGVIVDIRTTVGAAVKKGDTLIILEAMKMENEITAPVDGIIADIKVSKGDNVAAEKMLVVIK